MGSSISSLNGNTLVLGLTIFNEGAYLSLSQSSIRPSIYVSFWNQTQIRSWNQPVLSNESKVSCSSKQREPFIGIQTHDCPIKKQTTHVILFMQVAVWISFFLNWPQGWEYCHIWSSSISIKSLPVQHFLNPIKCIK